MKGMKRSMRETLEAIDKHQGLMNFELPDVVGYSRATTDMDCYRLRNLGLIIKRPYWRQSKIELTEKGKIVLALMRGKEYSKTGLFRKVA